MKEHVHGFAPGHCQRLFPELATNNFPLFQTRSYQVRDSCLPTVWRLQCRVFQMTLDVIDIFLLEILRPILWRISISFGAYGHHHGDLHRQSLANVFQAAGFILSHFFFPSRASVALARSSHIVVLKNELFRCIYNIPPWGVESGVRTITQSEVMAVPNRETQNQNKTPKTKTNKAQQNPQKTEGGLTRRSKVAGSLCQ